MGTRYQPITWCLYSRPGMEPIHWLPVWNEDYFCSIEHLSLKCCCLGDKFCEVIGPALTSNTSLLSLDLSSNQITDEGVSHLAGGLRQNRSLLSLCLAGNRIGDRGVNALCKVSHIQQNLRIIKILGQPFSLFGGFLY